MIEKCATIPQSVKDRLKIFVDGNKGFILINMDYFVCEKVKVAIVQAFKRIIYYIITKYMTKIVLC